MDITEARVTLMILAGSGKISTSEKLAIETILEDHIRLMGENAGLRVYETYMKEMGNG